MPDEKRFHRVATRAEITPQTGLRVQVGTHEIAIFNRAGTLYALDNHCPHRGASLAEGFVDGGRVLCPLHLFDFDLQTGMCGAVGELKVMTYEVKVESDEVFVLV
ncbi:MAG: nitrite reductase (NAD(P)H) small subunit [Acidobacteria bacterium]|nr:nitrite reductase (NAD(P)H) small subunit [Acidobacteriota bacterium]MBI3421932.1 nitrite reductase (NAD(P)H) small subunit [Acidobacteriota bacterium]